MVKVMFDNSSDISLIGLARKNNLKDVCAAKINGEIWELTRTPSENCEVNFLTFSDPEGKQVYNHSSAHILAQAIKRLYPSAKLGFGPPTDSGFFYDIDFSGVEFSKDNIESEMKKIISENININKDVISIVEAKKLMNSRNEFYKEILLDDLSKDQDTVTLRSQGEFKDICKGIHLPSTGCVGVIHISNITGAYWKGDSNNKMLTRIYGYGFPNEEEYEKYIEFLEEAKKRDHRILGPKLDLFFMDDTAPGMPYWLPNGWKLFNVLINFWREEHEKRNYHEISTPLINHNTLWKTSGHWAHYKENMFVIPSESDDENQGYSVKPMNCPNAMVAFGRKVRSYRELPLRFSDCDVLHRKEASGTLHGLFRVQMFHQDDSHNFITEDQIKSEVNSILDIADLFYGIFGLSYSPVFSTRPKDYMGDISLWNKAESELKSVLDSRYGKDGYRINEGDGAFYGPKIDIHMTDTLNRIWQTGTVQLDFQLSRNFGLTYTDKDGSQKIPVVVHRVVYGSMERFVGILIEHFAGKFPFWISPIQVGVVPISDSHLSYANDVLRVLQQSKIRSEIDLSDGTMGNKIKSFRNKMVPYIIIIGDQEVNTRTVSLKIRSGTQINGISLSSFLNSCITMNSEHSLNLCELF